MTSGRLLVIGSIVAAAALIVTSLALGGASYQPTEVRDPCEPRPWRDPKGLEERAEQFALSALDGAACKLRVTRETLALALSSPHSREAFARSHGISDEELEDAVQAGLVRAIDDAEDAGALSPIFATPLREIAERVPVDEGIALINDARPIFDDVSSFLDEAGGLIPGELGDVIDEIGNLPGEVENLLP